MKSIAEKKSNAGSRSVASCTSSGACMSFAAKQYSNFSDNRMHTSMKSPAIQAKPTQLKAVVQRDAYWPVDGNNKVTAVTPVAEAPTTPYIKRVGGSQDHEVHNGINKARGAARGQANIKVSKSITREDQSNAQARGVYRYGIENEADLDVTTAHGEYRLPKDVNCVMNHTHDNNAVLELHNGGTPRRVDTVNHFHAYKYTAGANIRGQFSTGAQPRGNERLGREHYFVNPF